MNKCEQAAAAAEEVEVEVEVEVEASDHQTPKHNTWSARKHFNEIHTHKIQ